MTVERRFRSPTGNRPPAWGSLLVLMLGLAAPLVADAPRADERLATRGPFPWVRTWTWESPRRIASILQTDTSHDFVLVHAPSDYVWEYTDDGTRWRELTETRTRNETRLRRRHDLRRPVQAVGIRMRVDGGPGPGAVGLDVETRDDAPAEASRRTAPWILVVNSTHDPALPGHGREFIPLARSIPGWENLGAQQIWVADLRPDFVEAEPRPMAVFFSGSFKDWCEVDRGHWRGAEVLLQRAEIPIWASCGGAQALAILADTGTRRPWDCPHCRDAWHPKLPIYTHIGHEDDGPHRCGDYVRCVFERGPHRVVSVGGDPAFAGLESPFLVMESHCGQIEYPPKGWSRVATAGPGTRTLNQCLRRDGRPIYAAQFHIEMTGTPETSRTIMSNFLAIARAWTSNRKPASIGASR
ncbi:MAG: hypothetical protein JNL97_11615 [Verrucomicrobiales bacterium]|nr:hypothetical protein [Verrucomicrobiales bacterium]